MWTQAFEDVLRSALLGGSDLPGVEAEGVDPASSGEEEVEKAARPQEVESSFEAVREDYARREGPERHRALLAPPQAGFKRLPKYQYTARDVRTGTTYFGFSETNDSTSATIFARYVLEHLAACGVDLGKVTVQTDNGSDLIGSAKKKASKTSAFEAMLGFLGVNHVRIPPSSPTWNSDVETFHRLCEDEFYHIESFGDPDEFFDKAATYQLFFNSERKNSWKEDKTRLDLIRQLAPHIDADRAIALPPIALGSLIESAYHVPALPTRNPHEHRLHPQAAIRRLPLAAGRQTRFKNALDHLAHDRTLDPYNVLFSQDPPQPAHN